MFLYTSGNSVSCRTISTRPAVSLARLRFRPNQCNFSHIQPVDWHWVSPHVCRLAISGDVDLQMDRIFATPSVILRSAGSVGMALTMWLIGATIAAAGSAVYLEYGTVSVLLTLRALICTEVGR